MPNWQLFEISTCSHPEDAEPAVAGLHFSERWWTGPRTAASTCQTAGFRSVALSGHPQLDSLATAGPDEMQIIRNDGYRMQAERAAGASRRSWFVENNYHNKITLSEDIGAEVGMSPSSVCPVFRRRDTYQNLDLYPADSASLRATADDRGDRLAEPDLGSQRDADSAAFRISTTPSARAHRFGAGRLPAQIRLDGDFLRRKRVEKWARKLGDLRNGGTSLSEGKSGFVTSSESGGKMV